MKNKDLVLILSNFSPDVEVTIQDIQNPAEPKEILSVEERLNNSKIVILRFE